MTEPHPPTLGVILAGGLSRRMGGGDKPLKRIGDQTILERVIERIGPQCEGLVLNANGDPARFEAFGLPVVADSVEGFVGPLAGILAGLDHAAQRHPGIDWVVTAAADGPFLPRDLVTRLHAARAAEQADLACAGSGGWSHPVIGLWPVRLRDELRWALIEEEMRKIDRWTARYRLATAVWPTDPVDPFFNANEPADIEEAERLIARHPAA